MPFRPLELPPAAAPGLGRVWLSAMPGRLEPWPSFLAEAQAIAKGQLPFDWLHLPMQDFGLAEQLDDYRAAVDRLADRVRAGQAVLVHCAAGIGRTGTTAACLLKRLGATTPVALMRVREAGSNPESALQQGLIDSF